MPARSRQPIRFGVDGIVKPHSFRATIIVPYVKRQQFAFVTAAGSANG
jgi:hypothetical protein